MGTLRRVGIAVLILIGVSATLEALEALWGWRLCIQTGSEVSKLLHVGFEMTMPGEYAVNEALYRWSIGVGVFLLLYAVVLRKREPISDNAIRVVNEAVRTVLDSNEFLTSMRSVLPRFSTTADDPLKAVPFLMKTLDGHRGQFRTTARLFLGFTLLLAVIFSVSLVYWGDYLMLDEGAGTPRALLAARNALASVHDRFIRAFPERAETRLFEKAVSPIVASVKSNWSAMHGQLTTGPAELLLGALALEEVVSKGESSVQSTDLLGDITKLRPAIDALRRRSLELSSGTHRSERRALEDVADIAEHALGSPETSLALLGKELQLLERSIGRVEMSSRGFESQVVEVVRRLCVGLVVSSFLLAMLRYAAGLYRSAQEMMLQAQEAYATLQRFTVVYRCAASADERNKALTMLVGPASVATQADPQLLNVEGVKDILSAVAKVVEKRL